MASDVFLKRIVVAVDGSANSEKALNYAIKLAKTFMAELQIVHVIKHLEITRTIVTQTFSSKAALASDELYVGLEREVSKWIKQYERKAKSAGVANVTTKIIAEVGKSEVQMITEHADAVEADMIVMGSRGLGKFKRLILGSITNGVVSHAFCPVFVVK